MTAPKENPEITQFRELLNQANEMYDSIPEDKDCKKCPHSSNGHSQGMMSPCFDYCLDGFSPVINIEGN